MRSSWLKPPGDLDLRPEVAQDPHLLEGNAVVKRDGHLRCIVAKHDRARRNPERVRIRRNDEMHARERARSEQAVLIVGEELDQQRARFLVDRVRGRVDCRLEACGRDTRGVRASPSCRP